MSLKNLLLHLDHGSGAAARLDLAAQLAKSHGAHLTGLYVRHEDVSRVMPSIASAELTSQLRNMMASQNEQLRQQEDAICERFRSATRTAGISAEDHREDGADGDGVLPHLVRYARTADMVMIGKPDIEDTGKARDMPHDLVFATGVPVIVVPAAPPGEMGERVVIAWNGSREAARAVKDALPILERARTVTVLCVNQDGQGTNDDPGSRLAVHLQRHGIPAAVDNVVRNGLSVQDAIVSRLTDLGADLLVMGAWGHSRLRELVLGGVTKRILQHTPVPVLMSH